MIDGNGQDTASEAIPLSGAVPPWTGSAATPIGMLFGIATTGILLAFWHRLGHDPAWLLVGANRVLQGDNLYFEGFVDVNPPLTVWLNVPVVVLANAAGLSQVVALQIQVLIVIAMVLLLCLRLLRQFFVGPSGVAQWYWLAAISFIFLVLPHLQTLGRAHEFAQREHWILLFLLPYVLLTALRLRSRRVSFAIASAAGLLIGLAISLKPHYAPVLVSLELFLFMNKRTLRAALRTEFLVAVGVGTAYLASVAVFVPGYFEVALPLALKTYWAYQTPVQHLIDVVPLLLLCAGSVALWFTPAEDPSRTLCGLLLVTSGACYCAYLLGGTTWRYHLLPFRGFIGLTLIAPILARIRSVEAGRLDSPSKRSLQVLVALIVAISSITVSPTSAGQVLRSAGHHKADDHSVVVQRLIEQYGSGGPIVVLSTGLATGFPAVAYAGVGWSMRFSSLWPLPAIVRTRAGAPSTPTRLGDSDADEIENYLRRSLVEDLTLRPADMIFINRGPQLQALGELRMDLLPFLLRDPAFASILEGYEPLLQMDPFLVFVRKDLGPGVTLDQ